MRPDEIPAYLSGTFRIAARLLDTQKNNLWRSFVLNLIRYRRATSEFDPCLERDPAIRDYLRHGRYPTEFPLSAADQSEAVKRAISATIREAGEFQHPCASMAAYAGMPDRNSTA